MQSAIESQGRDVFCVFDAGGVVCVRCGYIAPMQNIIRNCVVPSEPPPPPTHGPGTELSKLLKRLGIEPTPTCACRAKAQQMDAWGCDECERPERIDEVVAVMRAEAEARGLPFLDVAGRMLVRRAISNARRNA
jgi:hypothetical protein